MNQPPVRFTNTEKRSLEDFHPLIPGRVGIYTCGPTVYNHIHIGNLRTFLFEDLLCRSLRWLGFDVTQIMNLTDVDDKTIRGAAARGLALDDFTEEYIASFRHDLATLHVEPAAEYPRATRHIAEMIAMIERLLERGFAYESDRSVWFRISSDPDYGRLSGFRAEHARQGERVANDEYEKEDVRDFVLWKGAKDGEPAWDSPWGPGRPGWHIECSAMSAKYLGETFDIHCGGVDNIFPHHENEIAQSESANGVPFVRTWLHCEHLIVDGEKMSKSLGNQYTLSDLLQRGCSPRALRLLLLSVHYRQKLNFTFESLDAVGNGLRRIDEMRLRLAHAAERSESRREASEIGGRLVTAVKSALADDLDVAAAQAAVFGFVRDVNIAITEDRLGPGDRQRLSDALADVDRVFGVFDAAAWETAQQDDAEVERLVAARNEARKARDFRRADELRAQLADLGIALDDTARGTVWKRTRP
jgi:cysteinyl-tRNA synthetase